MLSDRDHARHWAVGYRAHVSVDGHNVLGVIAEVDDSTDPSVVTVETDGGEVVELQGHEISLEVDR